MGDKKSIEPGIIEDYPDKDFPWNFYFNGEAMPKWGACWGLAGIKDFLQVGRNADEDVSDRDVFITYCKIDHVGVIESNDPEIFIYVIQEVLRILLSHRDTILAALAGKPDGVYSGVVEPAFRMRELAVEQRCAFWASGYEADRLRVIETMRRCRLPVNSAEYMLPPHIRNLQRLLHCMHKTQVQQLHQMAQSGNLEKDVRRRLHEIREPKKIAAT